MLLSSSLFIYSLSIFFFIIAWTSRQPGDSKIINGTDQFLTDLEQEQDRQSTEIYVISILLEGATGNPVGSCMQNHHPPLLTVNFQSNYIKNNQGRAPAIIFGRMCGFPPSQKIELERLANVMGPRTHWLLLLEVANQEIKVVL